LLLSAVVCVVTPRACPIGAANGHPRDWQ
jgi:hypothetical protein